MKEEIKEYIDQNIEKRLKEIYEQPVELTLKELAHLADLPMNTISYYRREKNLPIIKYPMGKAGTEIKVNLKVFRAWCIEILKGKRKSDVIAKIDRYISQYNTKTAEK